MCEFISFIVKPTKEGLKIFTAPDLSNHSSIRDPEASGGYEAEWVRISNKDDLTIRVPVDISDNKVEMMKRSIRKQFFTRQKMIDHFIKYYLTKITDESILTSHSALSIECAIECITAKINKLPNKTREHQLKQLEVALKRDGTKDRPSSSEASINWALYRISSKSDNMRNIWWNIIRDGKDETDKTEKASFAVRNFMKKAIRTYKQ